MRAVVLVCSACVTLMLISAGCGGGGPAQVAPSGAVDGQLPAVAGLDGLAGGGLRAAASAQYELLDAAPLEASETGVDYTPGSVSLTPDSGSFAYAIFRLSGLGAGGSVYPETIEQACSSPYYLGVADYGRGAWRFHQLAASGAQPLPGGADLVSPGGNCYIIVVAHKWAPTLTQLRLTLNSGIPGAPTAVISPIGAAATGWPAAFNAAGSSPGLGAYTSLTYTFDGADEQVTTDPAAEVEHAFATAGSHTVQLTVVNDLGLSASTELAVEVAEANKLVLVVYNADIPEDLDLANYYMSPRTGRGLHPDFKLGLHLGAYSATIARDDYESQIRTPVENFILDHEDIAGSISYLLLLKGLPHQIPGANEFDGASSPLRSNSTFSSVDSELCVLYSQPPAINFVWNAESYEQFTPSDRTFYLQEDTGEFYAMQYRTTWRDPNAESYEMHTLDFLVGRLSAYTYAEAKLLVDRSLAASAPGATDWVVFDSCDERKALDTMVDPVWPYATGAENSGEELLSAAGINVFADVTSERIVNGSASLPESFTNSVIGYAGWGVNHTGGSYASGTEYILKDLGWNYAPGAVFMSYESFNGTDFDDSDGISRRGQGQICDFIRLGGTVAIGNAYEPFSFGVGDERWVFDRYLHHGDYWIEAAYKGLRVVSWQEVVVGDPLCRLQ